jgi:two-component system, sensor histidine kinase and response regulator
VVESKRPKILVVDDDHMLLKMISHILEQNGYEVLAIDNGEEALQKAPYHLPDLIILDIMMPRMNGLEVCRRLKANPDTSLIPVILLTANDYIDDKVAGFELGVQDYITKPFNTQEFVSRIKSHVEGSISLQKHGEQEKLKALETMLDQVAHELRNPLVAIGGFARRIRDRLTDDNQLKAYAHNIYREVERLERTLNEILEIKNIILGSITSFDPVRFLNDVLEPFAETLHNKHIQLETRVPKEHTSIRGDKKNLSLAITNIITNSIEAMDQKGGTLIVGLEQDAQLCRIVVEDTGRGISHSETDLVFRPFYTSKISGSGMGLYAVQHIVEMHNGTVALTSKPGEGTRVEITLPNDCRKHTTHEAAPSQSPCI